MQLIDRKRAKKQLIKYEHISFRCTETQYKAVLQLAEMYNTSISDVMLQLIDIASESLSIKVNSNTSDSCIGSNREELRHGK